MVDHRMSPETVLQAFVQGDFTGWYGLAHPTRLSDAEHLFEVEHGWRGRGRLGSDREEHDFVYSKVKRSERPLRLWLRRNDIILIDREYPPITRSLTTLLSDLGTPEAKEDSYLGMLLLAGSEWIYASRGLTLFLNPENASLLRIAAFEPSDLASYLSRLRLDLKVRRLPTDKGYVS
jgi:hypothetical protein